MAQFIRTTTDDVEKRKEIVCSKRALASLADAVLGWRATVLSRQITTHHRNVICPGALAATAPLSRPSHPAGTPLKVLRLCIHDYPDDRDSERVGSTGGRCPIPKNTRRVLVDDARP